MGFLGCCVRFNEGERGLVANPDAANAPAIAVPEALALPDAIRAVAGIGDIGWAAIIARGRSVIAGSAVIAVLGGDRAANNGATDQSRSDACGNATLRLGGSRDGYRRNRQSGDGNQRHQCFLHGLTFLMEQKDSGKAVCRSESSIFRANDQ